MSTMALMHGGEKKISSITKHGTPGLVDDIQTDRTRPELKIGKTIVRSKLQGIL